MAAQIEWKIVVVDDEADIREVLNMTLEDAGYQTWEASDGVAALTLCKTVHPQIVITDIRMPNMTGLEKAGRLPVEVFMLGWFLLVVWPESAGGPGRDRLYSFPDCCRK